MTVVVICDENQQNEMMQQGVEPSSDFRWIRQLTMIPSVMDACIDLEYDTDRETRKEQLCKTNAQIIIVNDTTGTTIGMPDHFIRINGWPGFLKRSTIEATTNNEMKKTVTEMLFHFFGKTITWLPDIPGLVTARVISSIVNEAFFALEDGVSSREEIDIAMKLGTNYPYGPFEWSKIIGIKKIFELLETLRISNARYTPSILLKKEAENE
ncbi:MAG: 3-hydroxyacyl-CoA dehydrogenase family protein [Chitinophagaceae bacterium]